jgi:hypothetical protein
MTRHRLGGWASWAPSGRGAVPLIVLPVVVANLVGVATVTLCCSASPVASDPAVRAAAPAERAHRVRDADVELRGRGEVTGTWVRVSGGGS